MTPPQYQNNTGQAQAEVLPVMNLLCVDCWHWFWTRFTKDDHLFKPCPMHMAGDPYYRKARLPGSKRR